LASRVTRQNPHRFEPLGFVPSAARPAQPILPQEPISDWRVASRDKIPTDSNPSGSCRAQRDRRAANPTSGANSDWRVASRDKIPTDSNPSGSCRAQRDRRAANPTSGANSDWRVASRDKIPTDSNPSGSCRAQRDRRAANPTSGANSDWRVASRDKSLTHVSRPVFPPAAGYCRIE
jgi:hypothetical protein